MLLAKMHGGRSLLPLFLMMVIMMMEIAVAHLLINGSAWNANVCVSQNFYGGENFPFIIFCHYFAFLHLRFHMLSGC